MKSKAIGEQEGRVVEIGGRFSHVMAITLNPLDDNKSGVIRCITSRSGNVAIKGNIDRSVLHKVKGNSLEHFEIGEKLEIENEEEILKELLEEGDDFIGLEDPDIFIDEAGLMHLYFTIPIRPGNPEEHTKIHLGHAVGKDLDSLRMTMPVLHSNAHASAKEVSIAPVNKQGFRYNLIESRDRQPEFTYSTVQLAIARDMNSPWEYGDTAFHPKERNIPWIGGHASPGPLLSREFIDMGEGKLVGFINGRVADKKEGEKIVYGIFSVGLFIYDYEEGKIDWVSPEPFIEDSEATNITFASEFIETEEEKAVLYAHVDDSFVRAYKLTAEDIRAKLP